MRWRSASTRIAKAVAVFLGSAIVILFATTKIIYWYVHRTDITVEQLTTPYSSELPPRPIPIDLLVMLRDLQWRYKVSDIPVPARIAFAKVAHEDAFAMADPVARWEATDVIAWPELPRRRPIATACNDIFCVIFYEHGGIGENRNAAFFRLSPNGAEPIGHLYMPFEITDPTAFLKTIDEQTTLETQFY